MIAVVGGHSRNAGKTAVICGLVRSIPEVRWTTIKFSPHPHGAPLVEETDAAGDSDTARYLAAGATRSFLIAGPLESARDALAGALEGGGHALIESNRVLDLIEPDLYLFVVNTGVAFKDSAREYVERADAFALVGESPPPVAGRPAFRIDPRAYTSPALVDFVRGRLRGPVNAS